MASSTAYSTYATRYSSAVSSPLITRYEVINAEEMAETVVVQEANTLTPAQEEMNDTLVDEDQMIAVAAVNEEAMVVANGKNIAEEEGAPADVPPPLAAAANILQPRSSVQRRSPRLTSKEDPNYISMLDRAMNLKRQQKEGSASTRVPTSP